MPCEEYKKYDDIWRSNRGHANYLRFNGPFAGKRKTKQMIDEAQTRALDAQKIASWHLANCPECQKDRQRAV